VLIFIFDRRKTTDDTKMQSPFDSLMSAGLNFYSPYEAFTADHTNLFVRVPLHMIASYPGVTRETLSRIRNAYAYR
jgi:hypothetical protein